MQNKNMFKNWAVNFDYYEMSLYYDFFVEHCENVNVKNGKHIQLLIEIFIILNINGLKEITCVNATYYKIFKKIYDEYSNDKRTTFYVSDIIIIIMSHVNEFSIDENIKNNIIDISKGTNFINNDEGSIKYCFAKLQRTIYIKLNEDVIIT